MKDAFRKKKVYFSQVSNVAIRDEDLSLKAKGLYSLIQSYITIEDFILYKSTLKNKCKEGEKAFESTWIELKDAGYLIQYKLQDDITKRFYYEYELLDEPIVIEKKREKIKKSQTPKREVVVKGGSGKGTPGKRGVYNNTDLNNTDLNNTDPSNNASSTKSDDDKNLEHKINFLLELCQKYNLKIQKRTLKNLLDSYEFDKISKSLSIMSTVNNIEKHTPYLRSVLSNMDNKNSKKIKHANFEQRVDKDPNYHDPIIAAVEGW